MLSINLPPFYPALAQELPAPPVATISATATPSAELTAPPLGTDIATVPLLISPVTKQPRPSPPHTHHSPKFRLPRHTLTANDTHLNLDFTQAQGLDIQINIVDPDGQDHDLTNQVLAGAAGPLGPQLTLELLQIPDLSPGEYTITVTDSTGAYDTQNFSWGVLALNTNKSVYLPGNTAQLAFAVLDNHGEMVCDANLNLSIVAPDDSVTTLSTANSDIIVNESVCTSKAFTLDPDYFATLPVSMVGTYALTLTATTPDGTHTISDSFEVANSIPFDIERVTATRIYPVHQYPVTLKIHTYQDYTGFVHDRIPSSFLSSPPSQNDTIQWEVAWVKDQDYTLTYTFDAPDVSPAFYTLGPATIGNFTETRSWSLAIDALSFSNLGNSGNPDINSSTDAVSYSNSSWTPPTSGLIVAWVYNRIANCGNTPTMSGNGITWVQIDTICVDPGSSHRITLFAADAAEGGGADVGATTVDYNSETQLMTQASFSQITGADLGSGVSGAFIQSPDSNGNGTSGSVTLASAADSGNRPIAAFGHQANEVTNPDSAWTETDDSNGSGPTRGFETQWDTDGFQNASATWSTTSDWIGMAAEVKVEGTGSSRAQSAYRWRSDDGGETVATWKDNENTTISNVNIAEIIRLRLELQEINSVADTVTARLEYSSDASSCTTGTWTALDTSTTAWRVTASSQITNASSTTNQLTTSVKTFTAGRIFDTQNDDTTGVSLNNTQTEWEWAIKGDGAAANTTYRFRISDGGSALNSYTSCAQLTTATSAGYHQPHYRIRSGDTVGLNADSGWAAALDTITTIDAGSRFRIRFEVEEPAGSGTSQAYILQYRYRTNTGNWGSWASTPDIGASGEDGPLQVLTSDQYNDGDATSTNLLSGSSETFDTGGTGEENRTTGALTISNEHAEYEYTLLIRGTWGGPNRMKTNDQFEFRMAVSTPTTFTGIYQNPRITVNMPDYYIGSAVIESPAHLGPFIDTNGNLYFVVEPTFTSGTNNNEAQMMKSTDGGQSWDFVHTAGHPTINDIETIDVYQSGDTLHICIQGGNSSYPVTYHTFRLSDHSTNADTWGIIDEAVTTPGTAPSQQACGIVKRSDNTIVIAYRNTSGGNQIVEYKIRSSGGSWGSATSADSTASTSFNLSGIVLGESDKTHIFYRDETNDDIYWKRLNSADALTSDANRILIDNDVKGTTDSWGSTVPVYWDDAGVEKVMVIYQDNSDNILYSQVINEESLVGGGRLQVTATANRFAPSGLGSDQPVADLVVDAGNDTAHAYFVPTSSGDIEQDQSVNNGGWDTDTTLRTATNMDMVRGAIFTHSTGNGGAKVYGYWYEDSAAGNNGFSWYGEEVLNTSPNSPSSLAQKTTSDVTLSTGDWHNTTSIKFTASASDPNSSDTLQLCVEKDLLGTGFSNTEDSCGSGVAYSGSPVSVTVTIASQTDASEYHWQARVKDTAGAYSSWVAYDVNAESARDYGLDTTTPTGGAVYDGTSAGVDSSFNDGSLSSLSANWDSFNSNASGLNKYQYSVGTSVGSTDIKTWTDNGTSTSVTATSLTLQTNTLYYTNVRAVDNAGNTGSPVSSNGQLVAPTLSFAVSPVTLTFSHLSPGNSYTDSQNSTLTTSTNAYNGYVVRAFVTDYLRSGDGLTTIADFTGGTYASPASWGSSTGYGYTSSDTTIGGSDKFGGGTLYAPFSHTGPGDILADHTSTVTGSSISNEQFTVTHKVTVASTLAAKSYATIVVYTTTAQY